MNHENDDIHAMVDIREQYRIMAQMEAAIRVKDNTGFDMTEYQEQVKRQQQNPDEEEDGRRYRTQLQPELPRKHSSEGGGDSNRSDDATPSKGQPQEPPLPFTRANRRFLSTTTRGGGGSEQRSRVPELCRGEVVAADFSLVGGAIPGPSSSSHHVVKCWGCTDASGIYLRVHVLATLVQCPECSTISPILS